MKEDVINFLGLLGGGLIGLLGVAWLVEAFRTNSLSTASVGIIALLVGAALFMLVSKKVK